MNLLTEQQKLDLLPLTPEEAKPFADQFEAVAPIACGNSRGLDYATKEGLFTCEQVTFNGSAAFVVWWSGSLGSQLWVHASLSLAKRVPLAVCFVACERIAKRERLKQIVFLTKLRGLAQAGKRHGFTVESVLMSKVL